MAGTSAPSVSTATTPPPLPYRVVLRVLSLLPRDVTLQHALRAAPEWTETTAVGLTLEFVQRLRSQTRVSAGYGHAYVEPLNSRGRDDMNWLLAIVLKHFVANRVVPQQLVQDGGLPLRRLIVEAAASRPAIWIVRSSSVDEWVHTVLRDVVAGVVTTPCCTAFTVKDGTGSDGCVTLRFLAKNATAGTYFNAAAAAGHLDCMRVIRDAVPAASNDLTTRGVRYQRTAAHGAAQHRQPDCLRQLLESGIDTKALDDALENIAHRAVRSESVECLRVAHEFGVDLAQADGLLALAPAHLAAAGRPECLRVMHELGVNLATAVSRYNTTPAHEAARTNSVECLRLLTGFGAYSNAEDSDRRNPAHMAAEVGSTECLQLLLDAKLITLNHRDSRGRTLTHYAAKGGREATLRWLLASGADANSRDGLQRTPGHITTHAGCLCALLDCGLDLHARDAPGNTMAHSAARVGGEACLDILLSRDANLGSMTNDDGDCPAQRAAANNAIDCLQIIHRYGTHPNQLDAADRYIEELHGLDGNAWPPSESWC